MLKFLGIEIGILRWENAHCSDCQFMDNNRCRRFPPILMKSPVKAGSGEFYEIESWQYPPLGAGHLACGEYIYDTSKKEVNRKSNGAST